MVNNDTTLHFHDEFIYLNQLNTNDRVTASFTYIWLTGNWQRSPFQDYCNTVLWPNSLNAVQENSPNQSSILILSPVGGVKNYCDHTSGRFVCLLAYLKNYMSKFHQMFFTCYNRNGSVFLWQQRNLLYVLLILWMMSHFHIMDQRGQNQRLHVLSSSLCGGTTWKSDVVGSSSPGGGTEDEVCHLQLHFVDNWSNKGKGNIWASTSQRKWWDVLPSGRQMVDQYVTFSSGWLYLVGVSGSGLPSVRWHCSSATGNAAGLDKIKSVYHQWLLFVGPGLILCNCKKTRLVKPRAQQANSAFHPSEVDKLSSKLYQACTASFGWCHLVNAYGVKSGWSCGWQVKLWSRYHVPFCSASWLFRP